LSRLHRMTGGPHSQVIVRWSDFQVIKKGLGHIIIIVLPGVHQNPLEFAGVPAVQDAHNRGDFHKIWSGPRHQYEFQCRHNIRLVVLRGGEELQAESVPLMEVSLQNKTGTDQHPAKLRTIGAGGQFGLGSPGFQKQALIYEVISPR
jgi:hypothetical protein